MRKYPILIVTVLILTLLLACNPVTPSQTTAPVIAQATPTNVSLSKANLTPNQVETSKPIYGGILKYGYWVADNFDTHQKVSYSPVATLPVFNQLVMFDINYKETVPETIIGDLADSWETSPNGTEITFHLYQGVKWHDGIPFTADDVIYSLDKMTDVNRSAISDWFPAYQSAEKIDDFTLKVYLKYPSAGFLLSLAQGESQIQALHLAGTDDRSAAFLVGTGPYIPEEYKPGSHIKYKRNPNYFKKDIYGNQLPYLDGIYFYHSSSPACQQNLIGRRIDLMGTTTGASSVSVYKVLIEGAPDLLWQKRVRYAYGSAIFLNLQNKPLDDVRVRRALDLLIVEDDLIPSYSSEVQFGTPGIGLLPVGLGLPEEEVVKLMGWDKPYQERVAEARQLLSDAGYPDGFKLKMMSMESGDSTNAFTNQVFAEALQKYLNIDVELISNLVPTELRRRLDENSYDVYTYKVNESDTVKLNIYINADDYTKYSNYLNPELDKMIAELDNIIDPDKRRDAIWAMERVLLTDLPALPTGRFIPSFMPYYPWVKNLRWNNLSYSNTNRLEDVWIDESLRK